eukprot:302712_1
MAHINHPSVIDLTKKKSVTAGKEKYLEQVLSDTEDIPDNEYDVVPSSIEENRLKKFSHSGEKYFKILFDSIQIYKDKQFTTCKNDVMSFNKEDIVQGTYVDNKIVLFGSPYNVYCCSKDVEPIDISHTAYLHKQKEMERNKNSKNISNSNNNNNIDEYKVAEAENDSDDENARLVRDKNNKKLKDPSLSDYVLVDVKNGNNKGEKQYEKSAIYAQVSQSDTDYDERDTALIIFKNKIWFKRYPYNYICIGLLFLLVLIFDILLIIFLNNLNVCVELIDNTICNEDKLLLVYDIKYFGVAIIGLLGLIIFCGLLYFGPNIAGRSMGKLMVNGITGMMVVLYMSICIWQMSVMKKEINEGINGLKEDNECNVERNGGYINDLENEYNSIDLISILKLFQGIVLVLIALGVVCMRSMCSNNNK